jgi:N-formylglutamate amidohydrolase
MPFEDAQFESISPGDIGLPDDARMPLRFRPAQVWSPVVASFPHVGLGWPAALRPKPQVDFARNADYEVQTLYPELAQLGVPSVEAVYSRLVVDLNRAGDDVSRMLVPDHPAPRPRRRPGTAPDEADADHGHRWDRPGRGVVWASAVGSAVGSSVRVLERPLRYSEFKERIDLYHEPYARALELLLERRRRRFGFAVLLDAHSMPSSVGLDLVVGTLDGHSCDEALRTLALRALSGNVDGAPLLSVRMDTPYRGGETIRRFGRPHEGLHAFQLEVSRRLYMDERTHELWTHADRSNVEDSVLADGAPEAARGLIRRWRAPPDRRRSRELAELLRRVRCLVEALVEETQHLGLAPAAGPAAAE